MYFASFIIKVFIMNQIKCLESFIKASKEVYFDKYDYSKCVFVKMKSPVILICKKCGREFSQTPSNHLNSAYIEKYKKRDGCLICDSKSNMSKTYFVKKARAKHKDEYDYTLVREFEPAGEKVEIIHKKCSKSFFQTKNAHTSGDGCPNCFCPKVRTKEEFIKDAKSIYGDEYDYSEIDYIDTTVDIKIKCNSCDEYFWDRPSNHLHANKYNKTFVKRCPNCKDFSRNLTTEEFIQKAVEIHGDNYDYSEVEYIDTKTKVKITCNRCDNKFEQTPNSHIAKPAIGKRNLGGCLSCSYSGTKESYGERVIANYLTKNNIEFVRQYTHKDCKNDKSKCLRFDFYVESLNLLIEYDGEQHFRPIKFWGGDEIFEKVKLRDKIKNDWAYNNSINLIRFKYDCFCEAILDHAIQEIKRFNIHKKPISDMSHIDDII